MKRNVINYLSDLAKANVEAHWYQDKDCYYLIVSPDGNTIWWYSNFEERF